MRETTPAIRCFVAMAVGRTDINRIYDKHILPTLRAEGIHAVFMGRLEHNDDIDKRIILEIEKCDFAIADLTYARPSVYFEAGFAQRKVPVIYTARADHLKPRHNDENLRVHFDLLMRNIITWSSPTDSSFSRRLSKRIHKVIAPMLRQRKSDERSKAEELQFQRFPLSSRLYDVCKVFRNALKRCGYVTPTTPDYGSNPWVGRLPDRYTLNVGLVSAQASFTVKEIRSQAEKLLELLQGWQNMWHGHKRQSEKRRKLAETKNVRKVVARLILCSLQTIPRTRLTSALPSYAANESEQVFKGQENLITRDFSKSLPASKVLPASVSVYVVDPIKSVPDATKKGQELKLAIKAEH